MEEIYRNNVLGIIFDNKGQILIGKYNTSKPNWTFPKGGIENNENLESAIFREVYEELGISANNLEILYYYKNEFVKNYTQEEIEWKIKNKGEYYVGKKEKAILIKYKGNETEINLNISKEFSEYKFIKIFDILQYINDNNLLNYINLDFLVNKINSFI
ncbi:MAG: NUDIX domain-containing protein [Candidatus Absconditabacteria bacterium]